MATCTVLGFEDITNDIPRVIIIEHSKHGWQRWVKVRMLKRQYQRCYLCGAPCEDFGYRLEHGYKEHRICHRHSHPTPTPDALLVDRFPWEMK